MYVHISACKHKLDATNFKSVFYLYLGEPLKVMSSLKNHPFDRYIYI